MCLFSLTGRSLVLEQLKQNQLTELFELFALRHNVEVLHRVVDAHALQLHRLVQIGKVQQLNHIFEVNQSHQELLAQPLQPVQSVLVRRHKHVDCLVQAGKVCQLVRINKLEQLPESGKRDVLH